MMSTDPKAFWCKKSQRNYLDLPMGDKVLLGIGFDSMLKDWIHLF